MLSIKNFTKCYIKNKPAVKNLSLEVSPKDLFAFIGHNGAGKSTLIKAVCGIIDFDEGEIFIDGKSIKTQPDDCKKIVAYVPDNPDVYDFMTGSQYLDFVSNIYQIEKIERKKLIDSYSKAFGIDKNLSQKISTYSHGMRQKLVLISSFIHKPKLLILDEPFVGLDPVASHALKLMMKQFCDEGGAIFFSTHVLEVAEKLCNKVAIIKKGEIIKCGTMSEIKKDSTLEDIFLELENE
ncbi:MAG: ABC transporter ATP-binding protein [Clostridia bacterium]|nr:ABC transporter ATP-binding protein [Clostridia bacterium]